MTNWFYKRKQYNTGGYTSLGDTDLESGFSPIRTPEDALLERIQRGEHNTSETFDDLQQKLVRGTMFVMTTLVVVVVVVFSIM